MGKIPRDIQQDIDDEDGDDFHQPPEDRIARLAKLYEAGQPLFEERPVKPQSHISIPPPAKPIKAVSPPQPRPVVSEVFVDRKPSSDEIEARIAELKQRGILQ